MKNKNFDDTLNDKILGINTVGIDKSASDDNHSPYEPTAYSVLDRLVESGYVGAEDTLVDFGCGKGRVPIYIAKKTGCAAIGVDMEAKFIEAARENADAAGVEVSFMCAMAEQMPISEGMNRFYFFNPFSYEIFRKLLSNIVDSYYENVRDMLLIFYYPSDEYVAGLMTTDEVMFVDDIDCRDLFPGKDEREKILIFQVT